jgi:hypothetical protein
MTRTILLVLSALVLSLGAMAGDAVSRVLDGTTGSISAFPQVARIQVSGSDLCTGVLISPSHVLTAASPLTNAGGTLTLDIINTSVIINGTPHTIFSAILSPSWTGTAGGLNTTGNPDLAILVLNDRIIDVPPMGLNLTAPAVGQIVTHAGFGSTGTGTTGEVGAAPALGMIASGTTAIEAVNPDFFQWVYNINESDAASDERGAPALVTVAGVTLVAGVHSGSVDGMGAAVTGAAHINGVTSFDTRVDTNKTFIQSVLGDLDLAINPPVSAASSVRAATGQIFNVGFNIQNVSANDATAFNVGVYFSTDRVFSVDDTLIGTIPFPTGLPAGSLVTVNQGVVYPNTLAQGNYFVLIVADSGRVLDQLNYNNDIAVAGQTTVIGNTVPVVTSAATPSTSQAFVGESIIFTAGGFDANNDPLSYTWNFGDATTGSGSPVTHTFSAPGTYIVTVTIADGFGGTVTSNVTVVVQAVGSLEFIRSKFSLNFRRLGKDSVDFALRDSTVLGTALQGKTVALLLGANALDDTTIAGSTSKGSKGGRFRASGSVLRYTSTKRDLRSVFSAYGATNGNVINNIPISLTVVIGGTDRYGAQVPFFYKARLDRSGKGKY